MGFLTPLKILTIIILPILVFLLVLNFVAFDNSFYQKKFSEYNIDKNVENAVFLHEKVINFVKGKSSELPEIFNEREKRHLLDVKEVIRASTILLYVLIALFMLLLVISSFILKINNYIMNFIGKVLVFGGILTIALAATLFFLINSNFSSAFESFHQLFFERGTYVFDPAKDIIINLYPGRLFMDLGLRISKGVILSSALVILLGIILIFKSKSKKIKNKNKK